MTFSFESAMQTYLFHRDRELRFKTSETPYVWPDYTSEIQSIWGPDLSIVQVAADNAGANFEDCSAELGCYRYEVEGNVFWVPTPLARFLPLPDTMKSLYDAADKSRLFQGSRMCLSGSSVLMGAIPRIGDLDLFEYVKEEDVSQALLQPDPKYSENSVICTEIQIGKSLDGTWPAASKLMKLDQQMIYSKKMRAFAAKHLHGRNFCKIDMIGQFNNQVGEITNVLFKEPQNFDYTKPFPSFTFQEVVVGQNPPPRGAFSLKNFGEYLFFLRDAAEAKISFLAAESEKQVPSRSAINTSIKVAKRAFALAALSGDRDSVNSFILPLNAIEAQKYALTSAGECINPLLNDGDPESSTRAKELFGWLTDELEKVEGEGREHLDLPALVDALKLLLSNFDQMCFPKVSERVA